MERRYVLLNVFTSEPQGGNPLAIITETDGLDDASMQAIAKKLGLSETVFVLTAQNRAHTASVRIFTPETEIPFAGHPSIGTAVYLAQDRVWSKTGEECDALVVLEVKAGILRIAVKPGASAPFAEYASAPFAEFDAPILPEESGETPPVDRLAAALGLAPTEIGFENFKPCRYSAGNLFTYVPIKGLDAIARARVVEQYWAEAFN
ncbi:MAG: PhzF family phenazine biosynthesis isomerase, partial [Alphaproteobacteria bacterium]